VDWGILARTNSGDLGGFGIVLAGEEMAGGGNRIVSRLACRAVSIFPLQRRVGLRDVMG